MLNKPVVNYKFKCIIHNLVIKLIAISFNIIENILQPK